MDRSGPQGGLRGRLRRAGARFVSRMEPWVFLPAAALVVAFVAGAGLRSRAARELFEAVQGAIVSHFGWFYVLATTLLVGAVLAFALGPRGRIRLGPPDAEPEFSNLAWFAMLLSAGMGIGLVFFGVAEPLLHRLDPPPGDGGAYRDALRWTFFHWGLHPWAVYTALALPLAFFHFRHGLPLAPRSLLYPLLGERIHGWPGHVVDVLCTVGTLFGVATSLGLGAMQVNAGLERLYGVPQGIPAQLALIAGITAVATISVVSGLDRGIRRLSQVTLVLATALLVFVLVTGPTVLVLGLFLDALGAYLQQLPAMSLHVDAQGDGAWQAQWTLFYWSWWISWSPFVGVFVARVSKGRTVREFVTAVLLAPSLAGFLWFAVLGGTGLEAAAADAGIVDAVRENEAFALFAVLETLPFTELTWGLATLLVILFFVTSSDSGSLVDDMVTSGGHPDPPRAQRVFWATAEGAVAATLLGAGGLQALRTASLTTGLPIAVFLLVGAFGLWRALGVDAASRGVPGKEALQDSVDG